MCLKPEIMIQSFNPYESEFPGKRVVSRDTILLMKKLGQEGIQVTVVPNNGTKLYYLVRKGYFDFLGDPLIAILFNVPINFFTNILSSLAMMRRGSDRPEPESPEARLIIQKEEAGTKLHLDYKGKRLTNSQVESILATFRAEQEEFGKSLRTLSPYPSRPKPVFLEHTNKIVGWASVGIEKGTLMAESIITDDDTLEKLRKGELKGYSFVGLAGKTTCSICKEDYKMCDHFAGEKYVGIKCVNWFGDIEIAEISIVSDPVQVKIPLSRVEHGKCDN